MDDDRAALSELARSLRDRLEWEAALGSIGSAAAQRASPERPTGKAAPGSPASLRTPTPGTPGDARKSGSLGGPGTTGGSFVPASAPEPEEPHAAAAHQGARLCPPERTAALGELAEQVGTCRRCRLHEGRTRTVFGVGNAAPRLCFVGEGPGRDEDLRGEPFVGRAGQLLTRMIRAMGLEREEVYICNVVKCRPPENRTPLPDEMAACASYLESQLEVVAPEVIVALGSCAARQLLETNQPMGRLRGSFHAYRGIPVMPTYHPAYLLRNEEAKKPVWDDLKQVMARLGLADPRGAK